LVIGRAPEQLDQRGQTHDNAQPDRRKSANEKCAKVLRLKFSGRLIRTVTTIKAARNTDRATVPPILR
jgi:hypothetical protein